MLATRINTIRELGEENASATIADCASISDWESNKSIKYGCHTRESYALSDVMNTGTPFSKGIFIADENGEMEFEIEHGQPISQIAYWFTIPGISELCRRINPIQGRGEE